MKNIHLPGNIQRTLSTLGRDREDLKFICNIHCIDLEYAIEPISLLHKFIDDEPAFVDADEKRVLKMMATAFVISVTVIEDITNYDYENSFMIWAMGNTLSLYITLLDLCISEDRNPSLLEDDVIYIVQKKLIDTLAEDKTEDLRVDITERMWHIYFTHTFTPPHRDYKGISAVNLDTAEKWARNIMSIPPDRPRVIPVRKTDHPDLVAIFESL